MAKSSFYATTGSELQPIGGSQYEGGGTPADIFANARASADEAAASATAAAASAAAAAEVAADIDDISADVAAAQAAAVAAEAAQTGAETAQAAAEAAEASATTQAGLAATSATNAASSATAASTSATNAAASATAASGSATAAASSATAAASSATAAAASYDSFDDRYLGAKTSDPTVDNDGNSLITGALYWNTTDSEMLVWNGSAWNAVTSGGAGVTDGDKGTITVSAGGATWLINNNVVNNSRLSDMNSNRIKGRVSGATGDPEDLTGTQATTILDAVVGDSGSGGTKGLVPAPAAGDAAAGKYLAAGGVWSVPAAVVADDAVTNAKLANMAANTIKGRVTASTGDPEDLTATQVRTIINVADGANNYTHPNHTGDVTSLADGATTIAADAVTNSKLANMASARIKGRTTASTGDPEDLTGTQVTAMLDVFTSGLKGLVPASGGGTTNFLRADGSFAAPAGGLSAATDAQARAYTSGVALQPSNLLNKARFRAVKSGNQTGIADATLTKITHDTEEFDIGSYYDTTNSRWTPPSGPIVLVAVIPFNGTAMQDGGYCDCAIYKNGVFWGLGSSDILGAATGSTGLAFAIDVANGTDYYEVFGRSDGTASTKVVVTTGFFAGFQL